MPSIKLNYLYRDASNYKQYGSVVLANSNNIATGLVVDIISYSLIDGEFFDADKWGIPPLCFEIQNPDDHEWHEFESIEIIHDNILDIKHIEEFLETLKTGKISK